MIIHKSTFISNTVIPTKAGMTNKFVVTFLECRPNTKRGFQTIIAFADIKADGADWRLQTNSNANTRNRSQLGYELLPP
jgi:hypothetical protein